MTTGRVRLPVWGIAVACLAPLAAQQTLHANTDQRRMLARYEVYNPSFRLAHGLLHDVAATPSFDRFLRTHSTIDAAIRPAAFDFVPQLAASELPVKPLIFVFVVDSLRPDYLGAYNPAVRFTPRFDQFASESVVDELAEKLSVAAVSVGWDEANESDKDERDDFVKLCRMPRAVAEIDRPGQ